MVDTVIAPDLREYVDDSGYGIARYRGGEWPQDWSRTQLLDLIERVSKAEQENVALQRALENTVESLNDLSDDVSNSRRYSRSYYAYTQLEEAKRQIENRICNHDIRLPHECKDCFDILSDELRVKTDALIAARGREGE